MAQRTSRRAFVGGLADHGKPAQPRQRNQAHIALAMAELVKVLNRHGL
jgi:hypothetical protein